MLFFCRLWLFYATATSNAVPIFFSAAAASSTTPATMNFHEDEEINECDPS